MLFCLDGPPPAFVKFRVYIGQRDATVRTVQRTRSARAGGKVQVGGAPRHEERS